MSHIPASHRGRRPRFFPLPFLSATVLIMALAATTPARAIGSEIWSHAAVRSAASTCPVPQVMAHRGQGGASADAQYGPENTSQAELEGASQGATMLNADIQWTSDLDPVALHDPTLDRTTTGTGPVSAITSGQFVALQSRYNAPVDSTGQPISIGAVDTTPGVHPQTLYELLEGVKSTGLPIEIQMESDPLQTPGLSTLDALTEIENLLTRIEQAGIVGQVYVGGWDADDITQFHLDALAAGDSIPLVYIQNPGDPSPASVEATGATILSINYDSITSARVAAWHAGGLTVWAWTPGTWADWSWMKNDHVDVVVTNWVTSYEQWSSDTWGCTP